LGQILPPKTREGTPSSQNIFHDKFRGLLVSRRRRIKLALPVISFFEKKKLFVLLFLLVVGHFFDTLDR